MTATNSENDPTVLRILLGGQLRALREASGLTREAAGYEIRASESKISRMELGRVRFKERDVADLLTKYGVTDEQSRAALLDLARKANSPGWWHQYSDVLPAWFQSYLGLEAAASQIRAYEVQFVPGLLQTPDYARAVIRLGHPDASTEELDRRVHLRMTRQELLTRPGGPLLWTVVDEAALRRPIGGTAVLRGQLAALMEATKQPSVRIQIVPFETGGHAGAGGAFSLLRFPDPALPDIVYTEHLTSAVYIDRRDDVETYTFAMERLCVEAEPPSRTPAILERLLLNVDSQDA
jgi:hypothetical protein